MAKYCVSGRFGFEVEVPEGETEDHTKEAAQEAARVKVEKINEFAKSLGVWLETKPYIERD
jgi:hypothetical protein